MGPMLFVRRCAVAATLAASLMLIFAADASARQASHPPIWGAPETYGSPGTTAPVELLSMYCSTPGNCVAVGFRQEAVTEPTGTRQQPIVAAESGGSWGPSSTITLPAGASTSSEGTYELDSVSCTSASSCVAVGAYGNAEGGTDAMVLPITLAGTHVTAPAASTVALPTDAAGASAQDAALGSVSCGASGCTAVGHYRSESAGTEPIIATPASGPEWSAKALASTPTAVTSTLNAISCPRSGACEAVGTYYNASEDSYPWAVEVTGGHAGADRAVPLPANFKASKLGGSTTFISGVGIGLTEISCPQAGVCTAAGEYTTDSTAVKLITGEMGLSAVAIPITNGTPGTPTEVQTEETQRLPIINGIWCSDAGDCALAGVSLGPIEIFDTHAVTASETTGRWSALAPRRLAGNSIIEAFTSMTCASAGRCIASGISFGVDTSVSPPTDTYTTFFVNSAPRLSVATSALPAATVGTPYSATLQASGGIGSATWSIAPGSLPPGLSLNAATGVISGTPTASGQDGFIATASNPGPPAQTGSAGLSISVGPAPAAPPAPTPAPTPTVRVAYLRTSGERASVVLSCTGAPCAGRLRITHFVEPPKHSGNARGARQRLRRRRAGKESITLARGSYSLAAGHTEVVRLRLSKHARRLLQRLHRISGHLYATPTGAGRPAIVEKVTFTSRSATKKHRKAHGRKSRRGRRSRRGGARHSRRHKG